MLIIPYYLRKYGDHRTRVHGTDSKLGPPGLWDENEKEYRSHPAKASLPGFIISDDHWLFEFLQVPRPSGYRTRHTG
jgi:hypothetical protein